MAHKIVIFDTSVFIDQLRTNKFKEHILGLHGLIRNSSVVLSELLRGATLKEERDFIDTLIKNHPILTPTEKNWIESGAILSRIYKDKGYPPSKLRDLHLDVLIALSARAVGALLITSNRADFELIRRYRHFEMEVW